jgi:hypothetical protein
MTADPQLPEQKPAPTTNELITDIGLWLRDNLKQIDWNGIVKRFGGLGEGFTERPREAAVLLLVSVIGITSFILALLSQDHEFAYSLMINLTTEMIGAGILLWLVHGRLSGLKSEDDKEIEQLRKELKTELEQIKQSIEGISKRNNPPNN